MMQALGLIEVVGLAAGFEAADVACKTAHVELVGYELAKGGGYVTIKVLGQVGAVNAAVDAAAVAAERINRVVSRLVIPRPNDQVEPLVFSESTVGYEAPKPEPVVEPSAPAEPAKAPRAKAAPKPAPATEGK
jgi:microcompartment protein CcmL/EutN